MLKKLLIMVLSILTIFAALGGCQSASSAAENTSSEQSTCFGQITAIDGNENNDDRYE